MRRREFVTLLSSVAVIWPLAARAQQTGRVRRVGVLIPFPDDRGPLVKDYLSAFRNVFTNLAGMKAATSGLTTVSRARCLNACAPALRS